MLTFIDAGFWLLIYSSIEVIKVDLIINLESNGLILFFFVIIIGITTFYIQDRVFTARQKAFDFEGTKKILGYAALQKMAALSLYDVR